MQYYIVNKTYAWDMAAANEQKAVILKIYDK